MNDSIDWSELSLQLVLTFGHFLWQACVVGLLLEVALRLGATYRWHPAAVQQDATSHGGKMPPLREAKRSGIRQNSSPDGTSGEVHDDDARWKYGLACAAFFALPVCVLFTFGLIHQSRGTFLVTINATAEVAEATASDVQQPQPAALTDLPAPNSEALRLPSPEPAALAMPSGEPTQTLATQPALTPPTWIDQLQPFAPSFLIGYLTGAGLLLVRFGMSLIGSVRLRRGLEMVTDSQLLAIVAEQSQRLGLRREPLVALCQKVTVPVVVGIFRPMILLPPALVTGLGTDQLAAILSHEMAHIRRFDLLVNLLQRVVEALLFFHPITWWISRRISIERENCCDDLAVRSTGSLSYVDALLKMAEVCLRNDPRRKAAPASLAASGSGTTQLGHRIRRLIGAEQPSRIGWSRKTIGATLVVMLLTGVSLAAMIHHPATKPVKPEGDDNEILPMVIPVSELEDHTTGTKAENHELSFVPVDATTGKPIRNAVILYRKGALPWRPLQLYRDGESTIETSVTSKLNQSEILVFAEGYEQVQLKLDTRFEPGKPLVKRVKMKAAPPVKFVLTDSKGQPAPYSKIELMKNGDLRQALSRRRHGFPSGFLNIRVQSDENGVVQFPRPAFAQWTTCRFTHKSGFVDIPGRNLPKASSQRKIRLTPYSGFKGRYLPEIRQNEFLEVYRLESNRLSIASGRNGKMLVSEDGKFQLTGLLAGWHSFVHRIRYTDGNGRSGTKAIAIYGPFELRRGQIREIDLGDSTRSVSGKLKLPANDDSASVLASLSGVGVTSPGYPEPPAQLSTEEKRRWWDSYWKTKEGQQFREYRQRNRSVSVSADGRFHFPSLPPGNYSLRVSVKQESSAESNFTGSKSLKAEIKEVTVPQGSSSSVVDIGEITVSHAFRQEPRRRDSAESDVRENSGAADIQWSRWGDKDGLLSGARLILPEGGLKAGEPLVVEYRLANVSNETKTLNWLPNKGEVTFPALSGGNVIGGVLIGHENKSTPLTLKPEEIFINSERLVKIDTTGLPPGEYFASLGPAFFYPHDEDSNTTHNIPHRGRLPFTLNGQALTERSLPDGGIHWGSAVAGLKLGAKWKTDRDQFRVEEIVEANLFVANVTNQPIKCSVELPHPGDGWRVNMENAAGQWVNLEHIPIDLYRPPRFAPLMLGPGEIASITGKGIAVSSASKFENSKASPTNLALARFVVTANKNYKFKGSPNYEVPYPSLVSTGGIYQSIFEVTLHRPDIPGLRLNASTAAVPFEVGQAVGLNPNSEDVEASVRKILNRPYQPTLNGGSWQLGAYRAQISFGLAMIKEQGLVADALMKTIESGETFENRSTAMSYCAGYFPERLLPYLLQRLKIKRSRLAVPVPVDDPIWPYEEFNALKQIGHTAAAAIPHLIELLESPDPIARAAVIETLVRVGPESETAMNAITRCFDDKTERVQSTAVYQAGRYGPLAKALGPKFVELLNAESEKVQYWAAAALVTSEFDPDRGFQHLLDAAQPGKSTDRKQALLALAMLGSQSKEVLPKLQLLLKKNDEAADEIRRTIKRIETDDRIVTHAEEAKKQEDDRTRIQKLKQEPSEADQKDSEESQALEANPTANGEQTAPATDEGGIVEVDI